MFTSMSYNKPFLITYLCTASFTLYLVRPAYSEIKRARARRAGWAGIPAAKTGDDVETPYQSISSYTDEIVRPDFSFRSRSNSRSLSRARSTMSIIETGERPEPPLTTRQTAALALVFCGLWFTANWAMNAALGYTSVSSTTILSSMSGFFTLGVGACVGVDEITPAKLGSVVLSIIGVVVVSKSDHDLPSAPSEGGPTLPTAPLLGDALALASALAYAFYVILLKVRIKNEARVSMTLFFGFVGLFNIFLIWPIGVILHFTRMEIWEWPHGGKLWLSIVINAGITFVSDALYLRAMLMTSPLAVTLGISLTIPLAMAGDIYRGTQIGGWKIYLGGALVLGSFVANGLMDLAATEVEEKSPEIPVIDGTPVESTEEDSLMGRSRIGGGSVMEAG
ncbi:solute carrier family 35, member F5, partial [Phenoliferia sp. Uapishka_3]